MLYLLILYCIMSLSLAAIAPHSPMLLPSVGKDNSASLQATDLAYQELAAALAAKQIETAIIISPLGLSQPESCVFNLEPTYKISFEDFGDLAAGQNIAGDIALGHELKLALPEQHKIQLTSLEKLDNGSAVPAVYFKQALPKLKILPLYPAAAALAELFAFGQALKDAIELSPKKIAVIAAGVLSQRLAKISPAGYSPKARAWDKKIIKALMDGQNNIILQQDNKIRTEVQELSLSAIALLLGCLAEIKNTPKQLSYEYPFGAGLLVMEFLV